VDFSRSKESLYTNSPAEELISISEQQKLVRRWWKLVNPLQFDSVKVGLVLEKLVEVGVSSDSNEARKLVAKIIGQRRTVEFAEFLQIFVRSMLKGAIKSLAHKVSSLFSDLEESDQIIAYKRALLLTGLRYYKYDEISHKEGSQTLKALRRLNRQQKTAQLAKGGLDSKAFQDLIEKFRELCGIEAEAEETTQFRSSSQHIKLLDSPDVSEHRYPSLKRSLSPFAHQADSKRTRRKQDKVSIPPIDALTLTSPQIASLPFDKQLESLAEADMLTREEYYLLKAERPELRIKAKYISTDVKPISHRQTSSTVFTVPSTGRQLSSVDYSSMAPSRLE
jgi:hypothetical protein